MRAMKKPFSEIVYGRRRELEGKYNRKSVRKPGF